MISYRFLSVAEEEMSEAALFYEAASVSWGNDFLEDLQQTIDALRAHPEIGVQVECDLRLSSPYLFQHGGRACSACGLIRYLLATH